MHESHQVCPKNCRRVLCENEHRFSDPNDWSIAGTLSYLHCGLPFLIAFLIWWELVQSGELCMASICKLPLPFVTKVYQFTCEIELFENYSWSKRNVSPITKKQYLNIYSIYIKIKVNKRLALKLSFLPSPFAFKNM